MAIRRPLVLVDGAEKELPIGDTLPGVGGLVLTEVTLDFGANPISAKSFSVANASAVTSSKILMQPSASPVSGRQADELEMDGFNCAAYCAVDGTITALITANPGPVIGQYKFLYTLG